MEEAEIILPTVLLITAFLYKLFVHQQATPVLFARLLLEFPVDIAFLVNSFAVSYVLQTKSGYDLAYPFGFLGATLLVVFFWRQSSKWFDTNYFGRCAMMTIINYFACISGLVWSIYLLVSVIEAKP